VKNQTFHFEIKDIMTQFVAAFDNIIIKRFNDLRQPQSALQVRYVYSPKQRVLYDIVNKAQNITIPVVAVSIASIGRDDDRVFNKIGGFYFPQGTAENLKKGQTNYYNSPVPVNIGVNMSIITKFQSDMDQVLSNFVPYTNPYIILSWKVPEELVSNGFEFPQEIRSEILWDGNITMGYPTDIAANEKYRVTGDTSFIIKGWLFTAAYNSGTVSNIFYVDANLHTSTNITNYQELSTTNYYPVSSGVINETETVSISGYPQITDINYSINTAY